MNKTVCFRNFGMKNKAIEDKECWLEHLRKFKSLGMDLKTQNQLYMHP